MNAEIIARALGGRKYGCHWMASCLAHDDHNPSLSIRDADNGKVLVHCHAGCAQALVIGELRTRGLWNASHDVRRGRIIRLPQNPKVLPAQDFAELTASAVRLWYSTISAAGAPVKTYLRSRRIEITIPTSIRFHLRLRHPSGGVWPGLVALVTRGVDSWPVAVRRIFLSRDGDGKAPVLPQKMTLGPSREGAVRLGFAEARLMVGEGIETCLVAMQATGLPAWAALSTSGLRALKLPSEVRDIIVLADGDDPGEAAARSCACRWKGEGRRVRVARPPPELDFNDVLMGRGPCVEDASQ